MFEDVKDLKVDIQKDEDGQITKIVAGESTYNTLEEAVKGLAEKDLFITQLKAENSEFRASQKSTTDIDKLTQQIQKLMEGKPQYRSDDADDTSYDDTPRGPSKEDIEALIKNTLESKWSEKEQHDKQLSQEERIAQNRKNVRAKLVEHYGSEMEAKKAYEAFTSHEEFNEDSMVSLLATSPNILLTSITALTPKKQTVDYGLSTRSTYSEPSDNSSGKTWGHYKKMMRENPKQYYSPEVQREIRARMANDQKFAAQVASAGK